MPLHLHIRFFGGARTKLPPWVGPGSDSHRYPGLMAPRQTFIHGILDAHGYVDQRRLLISARVVAGIDVVELQGRLPVHLHDRFSTSHGVVRNVGIKKGKVPAVNVFILSVWNYHPFRV